MTSLVLTCTTFLLVGTSLQTGSGSRPGTPERTLKSVAAKVPETTLDFRTVGKVEGVSASRVMFVPLQTAGDGRIFAQWLDLKTNTLSLYVVRDRKGQKITLDAVGGLANVESLAYFPNDHGLDVLALAAEPADLAGTPGSKLRHLYILQFNADNRYTGKVRIEGQPRVNRFASLTTGDFVVSGFDEAGNQDNLTVYSNSGNRLRTIDQNMTARERRLGGRQANPTLFVGVGHEVVAWRSGTANPLLIFDERGFSRELPLALPQGSVVANVLPSDDSLILQTSEPGDVGRAKDLDQYSYYQVNSLDGSMTRKLLVDSKQVGAIACRYKGEYIAYRLLLDAGLTEYRAAGV